MPFCSVCCDLCKPGTNPALLFNCQKKTQRWKKLLQKMHLSSWAPGRWHRVCLGNSHPPQEIPQELKASPRASHREWSKVLPIQSLASTMSNQGTEVQCWVSTVIYTDSHLLSSGSQDILLYQLLKWRLPTSSRPPMVPSSTQSAILLFVFPQSNVPPVNPAKMTNSPLSSQKFQAFHVTGSAGSPDHLHRSFHLGLDSKPAEITAARPCDTLP